VPRVVSVVFSQGGKLYYFDPGDVELVAGDPVIVSTARGTDFGRVVRAAEELPVGEAGQHLKKVVRRATESDLEQLVANEAVEDDAMAACRELVARLGLDLKPVVADATFDGNKVVVSFFAEERVDFRELVSQLSDRLGRRVELRQVTARDEARLVGGYGQCGRRLCCTLFAGGQEPVSIRMAKDQNLPLNPSKISGSCGRLMCCLKYEHGVYVSFKERSPKRGAVVTTPEGQGRVIEFRVPSDSVAVDLGEGRVVICKLSELGDDEGET